jgi:hypothetical protein
MSNLDQITRPSAATTIAGVSPALRVSFGATRTRKSEQPFQSEKIMALYYWIAPWVVPPLVVPLLLALLVAAAGLVQ